MDRASAALLREQLSALQAETVFSLDSSEAGSFWMQNQPGVLIIDRSFGRYFTEEFMKKIRKAADLVFVPTLYIGQPEDAEEKAFFPFTHLEFFDPDAPDKIIARAEELLRPSVRVRFWGVRGSTPGANHHNMVYGGNTSCMEITAPGLDELLIFDSGTGIRNLGNSLAHRAAGGYSGRIFITHPHWDHIQGFPFFKPFYSPKNRFSIHMPEQYRGGAQEILSGHLTKTFFPVTLDMLDADLEYITQKEDLRDYGAYSVEYIVANHPTKTAIYKIRICGLTIIYCPDNELPLKTSPIRFLNKFEQFIKDCDLLIHDGQFDLKEYEKKESWGHTAWERVVEVARRSHVKHLVVTHHDPDADDELLSKRDKKLQSYEGSSFQSCGLAKEGCEIRLPVSV